MYDVSGVHVSIPGGLLVDLSTRHITRKWKGLYTLETYSKQPICTGKLLCI